MRTNVLLEKVGQLIDGRYENPFELLGPHEVEISGRKALAVRAFLPNTDQAWVVDGRHAVSRPMQRIHPAGLYEAICPAPEEAGRPKYMLRVAENGGENKLMHDPYAFPHLLSDYDLHLLNEGTHWRCYEKLGAQLRTVDGVEGVNFAVWAPNATSVSLVGDFNAWDGRRHPMRKHIPSGFWELFVPGLSEGTLYKFQIRRGSNVFEKCDPLAFGAEVPPLTASKVIDLNRYHWHDGKWIERRQEIKWLDQPISIYESAGSWRRPSDDPTRRLTYRELAHQLVEYVKEMGYTHIELLPISDIRSRQAGDTRPWDTTRPPRGYGTPQDFMYFVGLCHQNDIGVILDWVPAHSRGRAWPPPVRRHGPLRTRRSPPGGTPRLGDPHFQLRPARSPQLPGLQRPFLVRQVPYRRRARRRGGFHALPRLQPQAG